MRPTILSQITEVLPMLDHAAGSNDRWLFIACLAIIMSGGAMVIRWLVKSLEAKDKAHLAERNALHEEIKGERIESRQSRKDDQVQFLQALAAKDSALSPHTRAIEALTAMVTRHDTDMRAAHEIEFRNLVHMEIEKRGRKGEQ